MDVKNNIDFLESYVGDPSLGLPEDIFLFVSRLVPMVNVDLLIKDEDGRTLLSWRDDAICGKGWHVPGGIVRHKETFHQRILKVAETEIGATVKFDAEPIAINQVFGDHATRGHFISLLYRCFLSRSFAPKNEGLALTDVGYLMWHNKCPGNLITLQDIYRSYI